MPNDKCLLFELCRDVYVETDGSANYTFLDIEVPQLLHLGWKIEDMRGIMVVKDRTTNFGAAVHVATSVLGRSYSTPTIIQADVVANAETIGALYSTSQVFCAPFLKALPGFHNTSGSAKESARISAFLVVALRT